MSPSWAGTRRVLLHGGTIYSPVSPFATAMLVDGDTIAWLGEDSAANAHRDSADVVIDLRGALVTPGFVDAHVHTTSTGLALSGLDLTTAGSMAEAMAMLSAHAATSTDPTILGHGWDDTRWSDHRAPTRDDVDRAAPGRLVYLSRIDVHSAAVSSALVAAAPGIEGLAGFDASGPMSRAAHHAVREIALASVGPAQRRAAQVQARDRAASLGVVAMHEMAGPSISSAEDLTDLLALSVEQPGPVITGYWGELASESGLDRARDIGAFAVGGDLSVDGAIGSRTACLIHPYADAPDSVGAQYLSAEEIAEHVIAVSSAGMQAGFHVIGDGGCRAVVDGLIAAAERVGVARMRALTHRLEHAEMLSDQHIDDLASLGVTASMQPMFDGLWGGPSGMYAERLGVDRVRGMNRVADLVGRGVLVAFGSDAPVTPLGPWAAVRAAVLHHEPAQRLSARAAFSAHTRSGWRAIGQPETGTLAPGAPAHYALWSSQQIAVQAPDERISAWSTDPRSGTPGLPTLSAEGPLPSCLRTVIHGTPVFDSFDE